MSFKKLIKILKVHLILNLFSSFLTVLLAYVIGQMGFLDIYSYTQLSLFYIIINPFMMIVTYVGLKDVLVETMGYHKTEVATSG